MTDTEEGLTTQIKNRLLVLEMRQELEPVTAVHPRGAKQFMERIVGTTKYLSNMKKIIYDVSFLDLYNFDGKIIEGCFAIDGFLYKIDAWAHIESPERFLEILDKETTSARGICFYLDDILYMQNVLPKKYDAVRDDLLRQRNDGIMWFNCLKIVDTAGNQTLFYPSAKALKVHHHAIQMANAIKDKKFKPTKKEARPARD